MIVFAEQAAQSPESRVVLAEGRAALTSLNIEGARRAAIASALRNAVEKTLGVYISGQTLTKDYTLLRDQVLTRSEGHAVLNEVIRVEQLPQEIRVIVRATVSLRPLTNQVRALGLARSWRVQTLNPTLEKALTEAGFTVEEDEKKADLTVTVAPRFTTLAQIPLQTAVGPMTMYTVRGEVTVRARRGLEVVTARVQTETARHINLETARQQAVDDALEKLAPLLTEDLLVLPSRLTQPVQLVVTGVASAEAAQTLCDRLGALPGVLKALKRSWSGSSATFELEVPTETTLASPLKALGLTVLSESKTQIAARNQAVPKRVLKK
ncbi:hypothetical protein [Armatimonas sp.]|uniref:hypothetical protein n=1 Tax=Armatimonas sp. TaxID=1872638 RepID=UPI00286C96D5|nr:hypothetical protein [Armatimonas sp.]